MDNSNNRLPRDCRWLLGSALNIDLEQPKLFYDQTLPIRVLLGKGASDISSGYENTIKRLIIDVELQAVDAQSVHPIVALTLDVSNLSGEQEDDPSILAVWTSEARIIHPSARLVNPRVAVVASASLSPETDRNHNGGNKDSKSGDEYLESGVPIGDANLLDGLNYDPELAKLHVQIPADLIMATRQAPPIAAAQPQTATTKSDDASETTENDSKDADGLVPAGPFASQENIILSNLTARVSKPVYPAVNLKLRTIRTANAPLGRVIVNMEVEVPQFAAVHAIIQSVEATFKGGTCQPLQQQDTPDQLGARHCWPQDCVSYAYELCHFSDESLALQASSRTPLPDERTVVFTVLSTPLLYDEQGNPAGITSPVPSGPSNVIMESLGKRGPLVKTVWSATVDFGTPVSNTGLPIPKINRSRLAGPNSAPLSMQPKGVSNADAVNGGSKSLRLSVNTALAASTPRDSKPSPLSATLPSRKSSIQKKGDILHTVSNMISTSRGLHVTFSSPVQVLRGVPFSCKVVMINDTKWPRHLVLSLPCIDTASKVKTNKSLPDRPLSERPANQEVMQKLAVTDLVRGIAAHSIGDYIQTREEVHREYHLHSDSQCGIVPLSTDIQIGPLAAQSCFETEIRLLPLKAGRLRLEGVKLIEMTTRESFECRLMPVECTIPV